MDRERFDWDAQMRLDSMSKLSNDDYRQKTDSFVDDVLDRFGEVAFKIEQPTNAPTIPYEEMSVEKVNDEYQKFLDEITYKEEQMQKKLKLSTPMSIKMSKKSDDDIWDEFIVDDLPSLDEVMTIKKTDMSPTDIDDMIQKYDDKFGYLYK